MIDTDDLRKLSNALASHYAWVATENQPRSITGLLLGAADEIDRLRAGLQKIADDPDELVQYSYETARCALVADKAKDTADYGEYKKDDKAE